MHLPASSRYTLAREHVLPHVPVVDLPLGTKVLVDGNGSLACTLMPSNAMLCTLNQAHAVSAWMLPVGIAGWCLPRTRAHT